MFINIIIFVLLLALFTWLSTPFLLRVMYRGDKAFVKEAEDMANKKLLEISGTLPLPTEELPKLNDNYTVIANNENFLLSMKNYIYIPNGISFNFYIENRTNQKICFIVDKIFVNGYRTTTNNSYDKELEVLPGEHRYHYMQLSYSDLRENNIYVIKEICFSILSAHSRWDRNAKILKKIILRFQEPFCLYSTFKAVEIVIPDEDPKASSENLEHAVKK